MDRDKRAVLLEGFYSVLSWYSQESHLGMSDLGIHVSRLCANSALSSHPLRLKHLYSTTKHSHAAIRKCIGILSKEGMVTVCTSPDDRRTKYLDFSDAYIDFHARHAEQVKKLVQLAA